MLAADSIVQNIPCKGGGRDSEVCLYPDGKILSCYLSEDMQLHGKLFKESTQILFNNNDEAFEYSVTMHQEFLRNITE